MIWVAGRVVGDDALRIDARDRTFEHGLGLFETFRTFGGRAPLLDRHLGRLRRSAEALGIPLDPAALPGHDAVAELLEAVGLGREALVRLTLSGGTSEAGGATLWLRAAPLPPPGRDPGALVALGPWWEVSALDPTARHKSLNYWARRSAYERARRDGYDEVLSLGCDSRRWEGSRTNVFLVAAGGVLVTPTLEGPIVPGVMRGLVLELARERGGEVREVPGLSLDDIRGAAEMFLTNSVRGVVPVARAGDRGWPAPGEMTGRLRSLVAARLEPGGGLVA